jgi:hypothetical protein
MSSRPAGGMAEPAPDIASATGCYLMGIAKKELHLNCLLRRLQGPFWSRSGFLLRLCDDSGALVESGGEPGRWWHPLTFWNLACIHRAAHNPIRLDIGI